MSNVSSYSSDEIMLEQISSFKVYPDLEKISAISDGFWTQTFWLKVTQDFVDSFVNNNRTKIPVRDLIHVGIFELSDDAEYESIRKLLPETHVFEVDDFLALFACALYFHKYGTEKFFLKM